MRDINQSLWLGCLLACGASIAGAQTSIDRSFTVTSKTCDGIQWSDQALERFPTIDAACQAVEERDGKRYVKFEATVKRNVDRGKQLVLDFKDGGEIAVTPPEDMHVYIDGRRTPVGRLERGDELNFYIAEDRLAAHFPETETVTTRFIVAPLAQIEEERTAALPATAGWLPLLALGGFAALGAGAALTWLRRRGHRAR